MADVKLCKDCKWCRPGKVSGVLFTIKDYSFAKCVRPDLMESPVTGTKVTAFCELDRSYEHRCGPEGKHWEPR